MEKQGFGGRKVLTLESRRSQEITRLIANFGGEPRVAPAMQEVPLQSNTQALRFISELIQGQIHVVIFLTGVGTRVLAQVAQTVCPQEEFVNALRRVSTVARGPKTVLALRELGVPVTLAIPEPNTWREILKALDEHSASVPLQGRRIAVQEYGVPNAELLAGLTARGATVLQAPVYQWALPDDTGPLEKAIRSVCQGEIDAVLFTTSVHVVHLLEMARRMAMEQPLLQALSRVVVASIGPTTSEALREHQLPLDLEASHPRMGILVKEAAEHCGSILATKRNRSSAQAGSPQ